MGIDFGTKRVGISLSDEGGSMGFPYKVLPSDAKLVDELSTLITTEQVGVVVFGKSHTLGGEANPVATDADACATALRGRIPSTVKIDFESEVYTTQEAIREQGRNSLTDASAATIILNSYLARTKNTV